MYPFKEATMQILPYLYFDGDCEVAFRFYERCLGGRIEEMVTHAGTPIEQQVPAEWRGTPWMVNCDWAP